jgi:hypothetical protein
MKSSGRTTAMTALYLVLVAIMVGVLIPFLPLPHALAGRVAHNSEGFLLALILIPWIQFLRPRLAGSRAQWVVTVVVAVALLAVGILLISSDLPSRFRTLNESFLAAAALVPYVQARRPLPRGAAVVLPVLAVLVALLFDHNDEITDLAEVWGALVLVPIGLDLVDRGILEPTARTSRPLRYSWYAFLVVVPIGFSVLEARLHLGGFVHYVGRCYEDFIAALLISLFLAVVLGRTGRARADEPAQVASPVAPAG